MNLAHVPGRPALAAVMFLAAAACRGREAQQGSEAAREVPAPAAVHPLLNPRSEAVTMTAPALFRAKFETSKGTFTIEVHRDWAPHGADRFYNLVRNGFYDGVRFFRVLDGFVAQFGIHGDPSIAAVWRSETIPDDPVRQANRRGTVTYATAGPNTRTTQVFINLADNSRLDAMGFAPFGLVVEGMDVVDRLYAGYGEGAPRGSGPAQPRIQAEGNEYLAREFPKLDFIEHATIIEPTPGAPPDRA